MLPPWRHRERKTTQTIPLDPSATRDKEGHRKDKRVSMYEKLVCTTSWGHQSLGGMYVTYRDATNGSSKLRFVL